MKDFDELKIRDVLKSTYDLFDEDTVKDIIFTTFNFNRDFFEEHIITYLMGNDKKISTIGELRSTDIWIKNHGVSVYYDSSALEISNSCITVPVYPQHLDSGVFHPKVIVMYGQLKDKKKYAIFLFVSSCNLTVSGFGRNQEVFSCVQVKSKSVAKSLLLFLDTLSEGDDERHSKVKKFLREHNFDGSQDVEFIWNYGTQGTNLVEKLSNLPKGDMKIISPYFDNNGPASLLEDIKNKGNVTVMPALDNDSYNIKKSDYKKLKSKINFKNLNFDDNVNRFRHAKVIIKGNYALTGSYNFTTAALKQHNAEAALLFSNVLKIKFNECDIDENKFLSDDKNMNNVDENSNVQGNVFISVTVDWSLEKMLINAKNLRKEKKYNIVIDGLKEWEYTITNALNNKSFEISLDDTISKALLKHKQFSVYCEGSDGRVCFGFINETNWEGVRPEISCETLDETIAEWFSDIKNKTYESNNDLKCINAEDMETEKIIGGKIEPNIDIFDNYYLLSTALCNMLKKVRDNSDVLKIKCPVERKTKNYYKWEEDIKKAGDNIYSIFITSPGSISNIYKFITKSKDNEKNIDEVYYWLIIKYINEALKLLPKKLSNHAIYKNKREEFIKNFDEYEKHSKNLILKSVSKEYLQWIEEEIFNKEI